MESRSSWKKTITSKSFIYFFTACMSLILSVSIGIVYTQAAFSDLDQLNDSESMMFHISDIANKYTSEKDVSLTAPEPEITDEATETEIAVDTTVAEIAVEPAPEDESSSQSTPTEAETAPESREEAAVFPQPVQDTEPIDEPVSEIPSDTNKQPAENEAVKDDSPKTQSAKTEASKHETSKAQSAKTEAAKPETSKAQSAKTEAAKPETSKAQSAKTEAPKSETSNVETPKTESPKDEVVKGNPPKNVQQIVAEEAASRGNYGRLYIASVGVDVALFSTSNMNRLQSIVDAKDSACMFNWYDGNTMIADHNYQGFDGIRFCASGTKAEIVTPNVIKTYTCKEIIYNGWNTGNDLTYYDFTPINTRYSSNLVIYTCNTDGTVTITIWG